MKDETNREFYKRKEKSMAVSFKNQGEIDGRAGDRKGKVAAIAMAMVKKKKQIGRAHV